MICKFQHDGMCCNCGSLHYQRVCMERNCPHIAPISNADNIRSLSDEELANELSGYCNWCAYNQLDECPRECEKGTLDWLKQPYKEDA